MHHARNAGRAASSSTSPRCCAPASRRPSPTDPGSPVGSTGRRPANATHRRANLARMPTLRTSSTCCTGWYPPATADELGRGRPRARRPGRGGRQGAVRGRPHHRGGPRGGRRGAPTCWSCTTRCSSRRCTGSPRPRRRAARWPRWPGRLRAADRPHQRRPGRSAASPRRWPPPSDYGPRAARAPRARAAGQARRSTSRRPTPSGSAARSPRPAPGGSATTTTRRSRRRARAGSARSTARTRPSARSATSRSSTRSRIEVVLAARRRSEVVAAMLAAHPYEEPAYDVVELADPAAPRAPGPAGSATSRRPRCGDFAAYVATSLPQTAHGVLVAGDPDRVVRRVAVAGGPATSCSGTRWAATPTSS